MRSFLLASLTSLAAHNVHAHHSHSTHSTQPLSKRTVDFPFHEVLNTKYANFAKVQGDPSIVPPAQENPQRTATELVKMTVPGATFRLADDHYVGSNGIAHFYFKQMANDLDIDNADFNVNIGRNGEVFSFGNSFYKGEVPPALRKRDIVAPVDALKTAVNNLELPISADKATAEPKGHESFKLKQTSGTVSEPEARLVYVRTAADGLALAWRVETDIDTNWLLTYIDAENGEKIHHVVDYAAAATYEVYPWGINNPSESSRIVVKDPSDSRASEFGWHGDGTTTYKTTRGNNGIAQSNWDSVTEELEFVNLPHPTSESLAFEYPYDTKDEDWKSYVNASITQVFYTVNKYHDVLYLLGFTEQAGNFQLNNNNKGGKGGDWVYIHVQDGSGVNNANFLTPVDGQAGRVLNKQLNST
ncbi:Fungalysin metallopeptidase-domain-containing protein [Phaeosphaeriaceae sp. PMI808]|nr:Fungalysin metallopeptidase-domain-containing protein [Phaeosphaeriaceae sp. PMI808]